MEDKVIKPYHGNSMKCIFKTADFLTIKSCVFENLQKGDVIAYRRRDNEDDLVVHRIIHVAKSYVFTKGDNNQMSDMLPVFESNLIGEVVAFEREGKTYKVRGGVVGLIRARMGYAFRRICYMLICKAKKYLPIKKISDIVFILWKPQIQKIEFSTVEGPVIKWIYRNHTVATWIPQKNRLKTSFLSRFLIRSKNPN
jgi:hypothetical protein